MKKISKANAKKFTTKVTEFLDAIGAQRVDERYSYKGYTGIVWKLHTDGGPLVLTLGDHSDTTCYSLTCRFEDVAKAREWFGNDDRLNPHSGKWNFHGDTVDGTYSQIKLDVSRVRLYQQNVKAEVHTDDRNVEVNFNAAEWFYSATDKQLLDLAACGFGGDLPADAVAQFMADHDKKVEDLFTYIRIMAGKKNSPGYEVHVNEDDAMAWFLENRPELHGKIMDLKDAEQNGLKTT